MTTSRVNELLNETIDLLERRAEGIARPAASSHFDETHPAHEAFVRQCIEMPADRAILEHARARTSGVMQKRGQPWESKG